MDAEGIVNNELFYVTTRWCHRSGWPADPVVQPVTRPVQKLPRWVNIFEGFFLAQIVARVFMARATALIE
jgi:hypothetical protein